MARACEQSLSYRHLPSPPALQNPFSARLRVVVGMLWSTFGFLTRRQLSFDVPRVRDSDETNSCQNPVLEAFVKHLVKIGWPWTRLIDNFLVDNSYTKSRALLLSKNRVRDMELKTSPRSPRYFWALLPRCCQR